MDIALTLLKKRVPFGAIKKEIQTKCKLLILGDPGVGKSTALAKLAIDILIDGLKKSTRKKASSRIEIPLFLSAKDFDNVSTREQLIDNYGPSLETRERFNVITLLIDGLDEVPSEKREQLLNKAKTFTSEMNCSLLVSTRRVEIVKRETLGYEKRMLLPFEFGQALSMIGRFAKNTEMLDALKEGLQKINGQIPLTALSLLFLIELVENNKEIPASVTELYERFINVALGMEDKQRKNIDVLFDYKIKKRFLADLAFEELFIKERTELTSHEFENYIQRYADKYRWDKNSIVNFSHEIERAGLLDIRDRIKFTHRSFLEYFIAFKINDDRDEISDLNDFITRVYHSETWCDVAIFYIGLRERISKTLITKILNYTENEDNEQSKLVENAHKLLFGKMLQAAWHSDSEIKIFGIKNSLSYSNEVAKRFLTVAHITNQALPSIYSELYTLLLCEMSYGSRVLVQENLVLINESLQSPNIENTFFCLRLMWSIREKISNRERQALVTKVFDIIHNLTDITPEEYAKSLLLLKAIASSDRAVFNVIEKKLARQFQKNPGLFGKLAMPKKQVSITAEARERARAKKRKKTS